MQEVISLLFQAFFSSLFFLLDHATINQKEVLLEPFYRFTKRCKSIITIFLTKIDTKFSPYRMTQKVKLR